MGWHGTRRLAESARVWLQRRPLLVALGLVAAAACRDTTNPNPYRKGVVPTPAQSAATDTSDSLGFAALQGDAATQRARALRGRTIRGAQDDMLRAEARAPGFAGFYLDSSEQVVLLQKPGPFANPSNVRRTVDSLYARSPSRTTRLLMASAKNAQVRSARFSLSELVAIEQELLARSRSIPGMNGIGVVVHTNTVELTVTSPTDVDGARAVARSLGIRDDGITIVVSDPWTTTAAPTTTTAPLVAATASVGTWTASFNPTRGGLMISVWDGRYDYDSANVRVFSYNTGSHGFNVRLDLQPDSRRRS